MTQILLAGKDWQARSLLRAQLLEEGLDVEAHETVQGALAGLEGSTVLPGLLLADLSSSDDPAADAKMLARWSREIPTWVIATRTLITEKSLKGHGFEMVLFKPVDLGELVVQIKARLESA